MDPRSDLNRLALPWLLVLAGAYYLGALLGTGLLTLHPANITLLWLPAGAGLIMAMGGGWRALPLIALASFAVRGPPLLADGMGPSPWLHAAVAALGDGLVPCLAAWAFRAGLGGALGRARDLGPFTVYVCLLPALVGAGIATLNLMAAGHIIAASAARVAANGVLAQVLGILLVWPLYQLWRESPPRGLATWGWILAALATNTGLLAVTGKGLSGMVFFILPVLLMLVFKAGAPGALLGLLATVVGLIAASTEVQGPCVPANDPSARPMLMGFVFTMTYVTLSLCLYYRELLASDSSRQRWQEAALHDSLTGLANRRALMKALGDEYNRTQRTGRPFALAILDIDHFKRINDRHGHQAGDRVLQAIARTLRDNCRDIDTVARIGGEEFAILLPETTTAAALPALTRILAAVAAMDTGLGGGEAHLTLSIGVVDASEGEGIEGLLTAADGRLYRAKGEGRDRIVATP